MNGFPCAATFGALARLMCRKWLRFGRLDAVVPLFEQEIAVGRDQMFVVGREKYVGDLFFFLKYIFVLILFEIKN